jgi:uncharacterized protein
MFSLSNMLIPAILFFALGFLAQIIRSDLKFPPDLTKALSIYLLVGIGIHGGIELAKIDVASAVGSVAAALGLGFGLPIIAYFILSRVVRIDRLNAAAIAAHYGSVSAGTFITAIAFLESLKVTHESYPVIMLAIMESPAIIIGLVLANLARKDNGNANEKRISRELIHDAFTNGSVVLLLGSMLIGAIALPSGLGKILPFYDSMFMGVLSLFLLDMGMEAARRIGDFKKVGISLIAFGIAMPLLGAAIGLAVGHWALGFSAGGVLLVAVLAASASYIAVPPAMRLAIPESSPALFLTLSLGVTFPFNVIVGIPLYFSAAQWITG